MPASLTQDTLDKITAAILNSHPPWDPNTTVFANDAEHGTFLTKFFSPAASDIDNWLETKVKITDQPQRASLRSIAVRIPQSVALGIYQTINTDVDGLRMCCDGAASHWY